MPSHLMRGSPRYEAVRHEQQYGPQQGVQRHHPGGHRVGLCWEVDGAGREGEGRGAEMGRGPRDVRNVRGVGSIGAYSVHG